MTGKSSVARSEAYWKSLVEPNAILLGCYPMGGCGLMEAHYRYYFELRHFKRLIHLDRSINMLELGCGNGRWAVALAGSVGHYTAVDFSRQALDIARQGVVSAGLTNVEFREQSVVDFKTTQVYDVIYFGSVTQYLDDNDITTIFDNLKTNMKSTTVIIDRSTISFDHREIADDGNYVSIYRTPGEIENIFSCHGFRKIYQKRSYRFLRLRLITRVWQRLGLKLESLVKLELLMAPFTFYLLWIMTWLLDGILPKPWHGGKRSHEFFVFVRK